MVAREMLIEPDGIENVAVIQTPCAAMGYHHMFIQILVRNRFAAFEALHAGKKRQIWHQFPNIGLDIKQMLPGVIIQASKIRETNAIYRKASIYYDFLRDGN